MAKRKYICPNCGKKTGADILYGLPSWELVREDVEAGYLVIGGCCDDLTGPERECTNCGHQWRIKHRKPQYPDMLDSIPTLFVFEISGFAGSYYRVEWRDGVLTYSKGPSVYTETRTQKRLTQEDWSRFWETLFVGDVTLLDWKCLYENPTLLDGTRWELELDLGQYKKRIHGSNSYPGWSGPDWTKSHGFCCLISAIGLLVDDTDFVNSESN